LTVKLLRAKEANGETPDREPHSTPHAPAVSPLAGRIIARAEDIGGFECNRLP